MSLKRSYSIAGLCLRFIFEGIEPSILGPFLEDLAPFAGDRGDMDLRFHVRCVERKAGNGVPEDLVRAIWAPMHRFPFEKNPEAMFRIRARHLGAFLGAPEVREVVRDIKNAGEHDVFLVPFNRGPFVYFPGERRAEIFLDCASGTRWIPGHLGAVFFQIFSVALSFLSGLLVHGTGVVRGGKGYAFLGLSGAGKSTVGRLSGGGLLADDGVVLRGVDGAFRVFATPFCQQREGAAWQEGVKAGSGSLEGLFFLEKDPEHRLGPVSSPDAAFMMLQHHIHFFRFFPDGAATAAFSTVTDLVRTHPVKTLFFRKDAGFWDLIE